MRKLLSISIKAVVLYMVASISYQMGVRYGATNPEAWFEETEG